MQLGAKRSVDARATLLLGRGGARLRMLMRLSAAKFPGPESGFTCSVDTNSLNCTSSWPNGKCENFDSVHWQRQQSSVQVREPETGVEKVKRKWLQRTGPQVFAKLGFEVFYIVCRCVFASLDSRVFWLLSLSTLIAALWFCLLCPTIGK